MLHWFKLCIHDLIRTPFQLESVTYIYGKMFWSHDIPSLTSQHGIDCKIYEVVKKTH